MRLSRARSSGPAASSHMHSSVDCITTTSASEFSVHTGLRTSALRYYEEQGVLPAATRVNGRRRYDTDMIRAVEVLRFAQQAGFTLDEIKTLFRGFDRGATLSARWRSLAKTKLAELDTLVERAESMRHAIEVGLRCGCMRIEDCTLSATDRAATMLKSHRQPVRKTRS
jgi:MerR family transcriptional regulator, redox-sensitive transcriptional activator SoxR